MLLNHQREKLLNAIIYFVEQTRCCGKTKLYKLLYFLDFQHFMEIGRSVTGLNYYAWKFGPVPKDLQDQFANPPADIQKKMDISEEPLSEGREMLRIQPRHPFDSTHFSKRELGIMEGLVNEFGDAVAADMIEATHFENLPWHQVYEKEGRKQAMIPYSYALRKHECDVVEAHANEHEEFVENYE